MKIESFSSCCGARDSATEMRRRVVASPLSRIGRQDRLEELPVQLQEGSSRSFQAAVFWGRARESSPFSDEYQRNLASSEWLEAL